MKDLPIKRVPRIKGLTRYPKQQKEKLSSFIAHHYLTNNFTYLNISLTISELAMYLNQNPLFLTQYIAEHSGIFSTLLSPKTQEEANKALVYLYDNLLTWTFESRTRMNTVSAKALGSLWNPGSGAIRPQIAYVLARMQELELKGSSQLLEIIKSLRSQGANNQGVGSPFMAQVQASPEAQAADNNPLMTRKEALLLIENYSQNALYNSSYQQELYALEAIQDTPEVAAIGAESEGKKSLKTSRQEMLSDEIILDIELPD